MGTKKKKKENGCPVLSPSSFPMMLAGLCIENHEDRKDRKEKNCRSFRGCSVR
jgi:hypothetical protein